MQANFGGPVWHASIAYHGNPRSYDDTAHIVRVSSALHGVHLRRRLTDAEWGDQPWGMDLRRTEEGDSRLMAAGCRRECAPDEYR